MDTGRVNILLVEDNPGDVLLIRDMLTSAKGVPVHVECAERLADALDRLSAQSFDLMLLDLGLPDSAGIDTVAKVHAHAPDVPIIVLTGQNDEAVGASAVWAGAQDYLVKGQVTSALLIRSIRYAISRHGFQTTVRRQALIEDVTGLYNRNAFLSLAQRDLKLARRRNERVVLLLIRTGGLGRIAATLGPQQGQRVFADFAQILRGAFRETDLLARTGPDEFAVLALDVSPEGTEVIAARVRKSLLLLTNHPDWLSFRVAAISPEAGSDLSAHELLEKAAATCQTEQAGVA